jgi:hypothetical protein
VSSPLVVREILVAVHAGARLRIDPSATFWTDDSLFSLSIIVRDTKWKTDDTTEYEPTNTTSELCIRPENVDGIAVFRFVSCGVFSVVCSVIDG